MQVHNDRHPWNVRALLEPTATPFTIVGAGAFLGEEAAVPKADMIRLHDGDRPISIAASTAIPQAPKWEQRHWPLAG
jgi:hypothetical protein